MRILLAIVGILATLTLTGFGGAGNERALKLKDVEQALRAAGVTKFAALYTPGPALLHGDYFIEPEGHSGAQFLLVYVWLTVDGAKTTTYMSHGARFAPEEHVLDRRVCNVWLQQDTPDIPPLNAPITERIAYKRIVAVTKTAESRIVVQLQKRCD